MDGAPPNDVFPALTTQDERYAIVLNYVWAKDFPNGSGWFPATLGDNDPAANPSLLGQSPKQLGEWGYPVTTAPGVDGEIAECVRLAGGAQTQCWAALDQLVMEEARALDRLCGTEPGSHRLGSGREHLHRPVHDAPLSRPDRPGARLVKRLAVLALVAPLAAAAACGGKDAAQEPSPPAAPQETATTEATLPRGGTLRVGLVGWTTHEVEYTAPDGSAMYALDPQAEYTSTALEVFRCCLLRDPPLL